MNKDSGDLAYCVAEPDGPRFSVRPAGGAVTRAAEPSHLRADRGRAMDTAGGHMMGFLSQASNAITQVVANAAPVLTAIRIGANRHVTGFLWRNDLIVTSDQALPAAPGYSIVLSNGALTSGRPGPRDPMRDLAAIWLDSPVSAVLPEPVHGTAIGALILALGADFDGSPTTRLTTIHAFPRMAGAGQDAPPITLDLAGSRVQPGGIVLDAEGRLLGMASLSPAGDGVVVPHGLITRFVEVATGASPQPMTPPEARQAPYPLTPASFPPSGFPAPGFPPSGFPAMQPIPPVSASGGQAGHTAQRGGHNGHGGNGHSGSGPRGWLGISLQPITIPDGLAARAGQSTARQVVNVTRGGPADKAGLRTGDVLLALDGHSTSGQHMLRAYLVPERVGSEVEVKLMRDGALHVTQLVIAAQPDQ